MLRKYPYLLATILLLFTAFFSCSAQFEKGQKNQPEKQFKKIESYTIRGQSVSYYRIPPNLSRENLVKTAQKICDNEYDTRPVVVVILIDDVSSLAKYINFAKRASNGDTRAKPPGIWADKHIIANAQKTFNGGWMLYENNGYKEIAYLKPKIQNEK